MLTVWTTEGNCNLFLILSELYSSMFLNHITAGNFISCSVHSRISDISPKPLPPSLTAPEQDLKTEHINTAQAFFQTSFKVNTLPSSGLHVLLHKRALTSLQANVLQLAMLGMSILSQSQRQWGSSSARTKQNTSLYILYKCTIQGLG